MNFQIITPEQEALDAKVRAGLCGGRPASGPDAESIDEAAERILSAFRPIGQTASGRPVYSLNASRQYSAAQFAAACAISGDGEPWDRMRAAAKALDEGGQS